MRQTEKREIERVRYCFYVDIYMLYLYYIFLLITIFCFFFVLLLDIFLLP